MLCAKSNHPTTFSVRVSVCGDYIEAVAEKLIKAGAPLLENAMTKVLTESEVRAEVKKEAARNPKKVEVPTELAEVDKLLVGVLESGDAKIDELLKRVPTVERIKESTVGRVQAKVAGAKTYVHSKVEEVRPAVAYKVEAAKVSCHVRGQSEMDAPVSYIFSELILYPLDFRHLVPSSRCLVSRHRR